MITKKDTQWGMESWFLVHRRWLLPLLPEVLLPYTKFSFGMIVIDAWKNSNVYINDECYGPAIDAWVGVGVKHNGKLYGFVHTMYNNNSSYIKPINEIFKFSKVYAHIKWEENNGRHKLEVWRDRKLILRFSISPTFITAPVPYSKPRPGWLIKNSEHYTIDLRISALKSKFGFTSVEIPSNSPLTEVAQSLKPLMKYSVFFQGATIELPIPSKVEQSPKGG